MDGLDDIVEEFLVESHENLDQLDADLVALEQEPNSRERLSSIFRTIHTIKGTSGFLAFNRLEEVTHVGENMLSRLRDGELALTPARTSVLLQMVDTVRALLDLDRGQRGEGTVDVSAVVAAITAAMEDTPEPAAPLAAPRRRDPGAAGPPPRRRRPPPQAGPPRPPKPAAAKPAAAKKTAARKRRRPQPAARRRGAAVEAPAADERRAESWRRRPRSPSTAAADERGGRADAGGADAGTARARRAVADSTIRVDVDLLDELMLLVGELVLTRNQIVQNVARQTDTDLIRASQRLNLIASELQEGVMKTRMQPIDHIWSKLPRVVRDLGLQLKKSIRLEMEGRETELDKTLLEAVKDPLTHLVRNSVDHGIEAPDVAQGGRQAGRGRPDPARPPRERPGRRRGRRRRRRHRPGQARQEGRRARPGHRRPARAG